MSWIDDSRYPFHEPPGRALHKLLSSRITNQLKIVRYAQEAGLQPASPLLDAGDMWFQLLEAAARQGRLRALLGAVEDANLRPKIRELTGDLEVASPIILTPLQRSPQSDKLERIIGEESTLLPITFLREAIEAASGVARLVVSFKGASTRCCGSGVRIGPRSVLTAKHVVTSSSGAALEGIELQFGYERPGKVGWRVGADLSRLAVTDGEPSHSPACDWAVVRTLEPIGDNYRPARFAQEGLQPNDRAYIVQHPRGEPKQIGMHHNWVLSAEAHVLRYLTDTDHGSSGAPVFNSAWELVAVHHGHGEFDGHRFRYQNLGVRVDCLGDQLRRYAEEQAP